MATSSDAGQELEQDGESGLLAEIIGLFVEDAQSRLNAIRAALEQNDLPAVGAASQA